MSKKSANALKDLEQAIAKALDALAVDGLYIEGVSINSVGETADSMMQSYPPRYHYRREIVVRLTNKRPDYVLKR